MHYDNDHNQIEDRKISNILGIDEVNLCFIKYMITYVKNLIQ